MPCFSWLVNARNRGVRGSGPPGFRRGLDATDRAGAFGPARSGWGTVLETPARELSRFRATPWPQIATVRPARANEGDRAVRGGAGSGRSTSCAGYWLANTGELHRRRAPGGGSCAWRRCAGRIAQRLKPRAASVRFPALDGGRRPPRSRKTARTVAARMKSVVTSLRLFGGRIAAGGVSAEDPLRAVGGSEAIFRQRKSSGQMSRWRKAKPLIGFTMGPGRPLKRQPEAGPARGLAGGAVMHKPSRSFAPARAKRRSFRVLPRWLIC